MTTDSHLDQARDSLELLLQDQRLPPEARAELADDFSQVQAMLDKIEHGHIHIAVLGRVSVGKSSVLNALIGEQRFSTSALHGETKHNEMAHWNEQESGSLFLIDTPGINEIDGEARERMAHEVSQRSDLVLFVIDGDMTDSEYEALQQLAQEHRPLLLVLNKCDRYTSVQRTELRDSLLARLGNLIPVENLVEVAADPPARIVISIDAEGMETETERPSPPDITVLKERIWEILEAEGKTLAALNASLFAGDLSDKVGMRVLAARSQLGEKVIRSYSLVKGLAVAINPVPVADLAAAIAVDISMIVHLSNVYGMPMTRSQSGTLIKAISGQLLLLMGATWLVHLASSLLKAGSVGLSTLLTAGAQGAVAYYSTYVVGRAAEEYLAAGCSWGEDGPKQVIRNILDTIDRDSMLAGARKDILARIRTTRS
ncbi:MAG: GTP-binding protein [Gammaproteobacteria bacterium]|nr:GTP-binding protein [Gammaproteobacteria bacterium]MDH3934813.1 GTP-binding protein [Gammaproteobacteria bacterium]MDH3984801.1 GTP-binding protein [Gammaproteobacteria bacterium]